MKLDHMNRREFFAPLVGAAVWASAAQAQQSAIPVVGFMSGGSPSDAFLLTAFNRGLNEAGFIDGTNVTVEVRWAGGQSDRLPSLMSDLLQRKAAVIAAVGGPNPPLAAKAATSTVPIIFVTATDPIDSGLIKNFGRPEANLTGVHLLGTQLNPKRQELLHELVPTASSIAALMNPTRASTGDEIRDMQAAANKIGQRLQVLNVSNEREMDVAFATIVEQRIGGLLVQGDPFFTSRRDQLVLLTTRHAIPTIFAWREFPAAGGLMSYGPSLGSAYAQAGVYAGRLLKGEKVADLPVVQPTTFELVVNLKAAKALAVNIPPTLLGRADEVIE